MREQILKILHETLNDCIEKKEISLEEIPTIEITKTSRKEHGDFATNLALVLASALKKKPREIAEVIVKNLKDPEKKIQKIEVAGPGFVNFTFSPEAYQQVLAKILNQKENFGKIDFGKNKKILIEYVSANPTGPMHVGHGRSAVVGDVLARVLAASGYQVSKEFYVNDHGVQIRTLGNSVLYYLKKLDSSQTSVPPPPADSYQGEYLETIVNNHSKELQAFGEDPMRVGKEVGKELLDEIKKDLASLNIYFDHFFHESSLYESGEIDRALHELKEEGYIYLKEDATWFRSTTFGDDKDRVLIKKDGSYTYFTPDLAYHRNKYERRFDEYINIWGADHAGYIPRIKAVVEAMEYDPDKLKVITVQMVQLKRGSERVQMSKRTGSYVTLKEIVQEVGADATRFFFILRSSNSQLDFDLELAKKQSPDNPVYYIQYAHARICSIFQKAKDSKIDFNAISKADLSHLTLPEEFDLIHELVRYPEVLEEVAISLEPHSIAFYLINLAKLFQNYYSRAKNNDRYRVISADPKITLAKLAFLTALKIVFQCGLEILGVSAPEFMAQSVEEEESSPL